jgi:hypothetical protein
VLCGVVSLAVEPLKAVGSRMVETRADGPGRIIVFGLLMVNARDDNPLPRVSCVSAVTSHVGRFQDACVSTAARGSEIGCSGSSCPAGYHAAGEGGAIAERVRLTQRRGQKAASGKKAAAGRKPPAKKPVAKKVAAGRKAVAKRAVTNKAAPGKKPAAKKAAAKATSSSRTTAKKTR